jgi:hypothetical protein
MDEIKPLIFRGFFLLANGMPGNPKHRRAESFDGNHDGIPVKER